MLTIFKIFKRMNQLEERVTKLERGVAAVTTTDLKEVANKIHEKQQSTIRRGF
ncbi:hypothetical protein D3C79_1091610 [compost metagenome]